MLNSPQLYDELGAKVAEARNQKDEARAKFHADHFRRAKDLEQGDDKTLAQPCTTTLTRPIAVCLVSSISDKEQS